MKVCSVDMHLWYKTFPKVRVKIMNPSGEKHMFTSKEAQRAASQRKWKEK